MTPELSLCPMEVRHGSAQLFTNNFQDSLKNHLIPFLRLSCQGFTAWFGLWLCSLVHLLGQRLTVMYGSFSARPAGQGAFHSSPSEVS